MIVHIIINTIRTIYFFLDIIYCNQYIISDDFITTIHDTYFILSTISGDSVSAGIPVYTNA